jgi:hypothetical protein
MYVIIGCTIDEVELFSEILGHATNIAFDVADFVVSRRREPHVSFCIKGIFEVK